MWLYFIPLYIVGALLVLLLTFLLLGRIRGGRYLRPVITLLMRVPLLKRLIEKGTKASLEKHNPELASAIRKLERVGAHRDPQKVQTALSGMSAAERAAWLEAAGQQQSAGPGPSNRAERRAMERMQKGKLPKPQQRRSR